MAGHEICSHVSTVHARTTAQGVQSNILYDVCRSVAAGTQQRLPLLPILLNPWPCECMPGRQVALGLCEVYVSIGHCMSCCFAGVLQWWKAKLRACQIYTMHPSRPSPADVYMLMLCCEQAKRGGGRRGQGPGSRALFKSTHDILRPLSCNNTHVLDICAAAVLQKGEAKPRARQPSCPLSKDAKGSSNTTVTN